MRRYLSAHAPASTGVAINKKQLHLKYGKASGSYLLSANSMSNNCILLSYLEEEEEKNPFFAVRDRQRQREAEFPLEHVLCG